MWVHGKTIKTIQKGLHVRLGLFPTSYMYVNIYYIEKIYFYVFLLNNIPNFFFIQL